MQSTTQILQKIRVLEAKIDEALDEASQTQSQLDEALDSAYLSQAEFEELDQCDQAINEMLTRMIHRADELCQRSRSAESKAELLQPAEETPSVGC